MTTLRDLNRAVQSAEFPSHEWAQAVREMLNGVAERMEPEGESFESAYPELAKLECPECRHFTYHDPDCSLAPEIETEDEKFDGGAA